MSTAQCTASCPEGEGKPGLELTAALVKFLGKSLKLDKAARLRS